MNEKMTTPSKKLWQTAKASLTVFTSYLIVLFVLNRLVKFCNFWRTDRPTDRQT